MAVDFESQVPTTPSGPYKVGIIELITRSLDVWISGLLRYIVLALPIALINLIPTFLLLFTALPEIIDRILLGEDPLTAIFTLVFQGHYQLFPLLVILTVIGIIIESLLIGTIAKHGSDSYLRNTVSSISECISVAIAKFPTIFSVRLLFTALDLVLITAVMMVFLNVLLEYILYSLSLTYLLIILGLLLTIMLLIIYLNTRLILSLAMPILEGTSALDSLRRSWALSRGHFWHIFIANMILGIIIGLGTTSLTYSIMTVGIFSNMETVLLLSGLLSVLISIIFTPLSIVFYVVLYGDLDARSKEIAASYW